MERSGSDSDVRCRSDPGLWISRASGRGSRFEVDAPSHRYRDEDVRSKVLRELGFTILRYDNDEIAKYYHAVIAEIRYEIDMLSKRG